MLTRIKTRAEIGAMRESGRMLAVVLDALRVMTKAGMSTKYLADYAAQELHKLGGQPAFLNYQGFPDVLCVSVNDEVVHGIPRIDKFIKQDDIVSLDFGVEYRGMITDSATSFIVGLGKPEDKKLVEVTEKSLYAGIKVLRDKVKTGTIGSSVEKVLDEHRYGIVRDLVGHGVGHSLHEDPNIPNYGRKDTGIILRSGMTIAIEPMATLGTEKVYIAEDGWTILTYDHSRSAHFEHTVLITDNGSEILTLS